MLPAMPSQGFVVAAGGGRALPGAGGRLLAGVSDTAGAFSLILSHAPQGDRVPLHVHDVVDESFYVLDGRYRIQCGGQALTAGPSDFVYLPRGVPHSYQVVDGPAAKLILAVPGGIEAFFDDVAADVDLDELMHRHRVRFLD